MRGEIVWFSHKEIIYTTERDRFEWTKPSKEKEKNWKIWNWDNCTVSLAKPSKDKTLVVVRSKANRNSKYMGDRPIKLRFMLGLEVKEVVSGPRPVVERVKRGKAPDAGEWDGPRDRCVIRLRGRPSGDSEWCDDYWIWVYDDDESGKKYLHMFVTEINRVIKSGADGDGTLPCASVFEVGDVADTDEIIPVIYQPAVDSLKNFVREVHCKRKQGSDEIEVTLIFENEHLQKTAEVDRAYRFSRRDIFFGREKDVETFKIKLDEDGAPKNLVFPGIYSKVEGKEGELVERDLRSDDVHGDATKKEEHPPLRQIKHCFLNGNHPIIFVNTSNHAMAEDDANHRLWKWEYVPWEKDGTLEFGSNSRLEVERMFPPPPFWGIPRRIVFDWGNKIWSKIRRSG